MKLFTSYGKIFLSVSKRKSFIRGDFLKKSISVFLTILICLSTFLCSPKAEAASSIKGAGKVTTASTALNVRSSANKTSAVKTTLKRNSYVTLVSKSGEFWRVQYSSSGYGYCHEDYITTASTKVRTVKTSSGRLRVRSSASASATVKAYLSSGEKVTVLSQSGSFSKILYNGTKIGYAHSDYLSTAASSSYKAIKLSVPDFKQTDSRWASVTLGSSGQTIGKIGCATTALAMTESHRTGTTIYPNQMAKKLSYTSGGAVYWPTNYTVITSSDGYLSKIYSALKSGKPVIVGAKKSNGSQHYVVVTGVKATDTLTASSFYINDPGSTSRVTLNQFFSAYPNFYKMLYVK